MSCPSGLFEVESRPEVAVARVHVDLDLPHLDHPLDYVIPEELAERVVPGALVKVRVAGRKYQGWVVETTAIDPGERRLLPVDTVVSRGPVLDPSTYELAGYLARRSVSTVAHVLSLALPPRHASAEKEVRSSIPAPTFVSLGQPLTSAESVADADTTNTDTPGTDTPGTDTRGTEPPGSDTMADATGAHTTAGTTAGTTDAEAKADSADVPHTAVGAQPVTSEDEASWRPYAFGDSFMRAVGAGARPRAVWTPLPGHRDEPLRALIRVIHRRSESALIVVPTHAQARDLAEDLTQALPECRIGVYHADLPAAQRYQMHLEAMCGVYDVIVGTRSAVWLPSPAAGMILVWDDGDDRLRERRAPRVDALDVAIARATLRPCTIVAAAWARSVKAQALVESGWAHALESPWEVRRSVLPKIHVEDEFEIQREGARAHSQITASSQQSIRRALTRGPVLVQVPQAGFVPRVACQSCREVARCASCGGQLSVTADQHIRCTWCAREVTQWSCPHCRGHELRAVRVGSELTGENLGRAFPGIPLVMSTAAHDVTDIPDRRPRLVVATPGREPAVDGGYAMVLVVDAPAIAHRPELWAPEEAMRRWMNAFALLAPDGQGRISGGVDPLLAQTLIRWDPAYLAHSLLNERRELGFFPAATIIALDGPQADVSDIVHQCDTDILGMVPRTERDPDSPPLVRALLRSSFADTPALADRLIGIQQQRSAKKLPLVKVTVNPPELF